MVYNPVYKIVPGSAGSFLCPPGHPNHTHHLEGFDSPRHRNVSFSGGLDYALTDEYDGSQAVKDRVRKMMDGAQLVASDMWIKEVYGYFRNCYSPDGVTRDVSKALIHRPATAPAIDPARHLAVMLIRKYFPDHEPRHDLIADPGNGYGSHPCTKCGERVQYEAKYDRLAKVTTRMDGRGMTHWSYGTECTDGGQHTR